jgi:putative hydrolase of the HAD superfamily
MIEGIKVVGFDADDTLWENQKYYLETESKLRQLLAPYVSEDVVLKELAATEDSNMSLYGYGVKAHILSVIETAIRITDAKVPVEVIGKILLLGKEQLRRPVELLDGVEDTLSALEGRYRLVVVTKGDLLDQEGKLRRSGIDHFFCHAEIMSDKTDEAYLTLLRRMNIKPEEFLMIGNAMRSDILPPLRIGSYAIHIPFSTTWAHEDVDGAVQSPRLHTLKSMREVVSLL